MCEIQWNLIEPEHVAPAQVRVGMYSGAGSARVRLLAKKGPNKNRLFFSCTSTHICQRDSTYALHQWTKFEKNLTFLSAILLFANKLDTVWETKFLQNSTENRCPLNVPYEIALTQTNFLFPQLKNILILVSGQALVYSCPKLHVLQHIHCKVISFFQWDEGCKLHCAGVWW